MYKLFLCLRYLRKRRIAFFAIAAVWLCSAMVLIVISVMGGFLDMVKSRSRGLLGDLVMENGSLQGFPFYEEFIDHVKREYAAQVEEATPVIVNYALIRFPTRNITKPVQLVGIRLEETYRVNDFRNSLFYERYYPGTTRLEEQRIPAYGIDREGRMVLPPELQSAYERWLQQAGPEEKQAAGKQRHYGLYPGPGLYYPITHFREDVSDPAPGWSEETLPGLIAGIDVCAYRRDDGEYERVYPRGYQVLVTLLPLTPKGTLAGRGGTPPQIAFQLVDDSATGVYDIDSFSAYADFEIVQNALLMNRREADDGRVFPARTTQIQVKLRPGVDPARMKRTLQEDWRRFAAARLDQTDEPDLLEDVTVQTWEEKQIKFIAAVEKEKILVTILFGIISLVAVLLVGCIFYMIVQQKTRDIGIVKSLGATWRGVASIFLAYGAAVGVVGGMLGLICGSVFVYYINDLQDLLTRIHPNLKVWDPAVYTFTRIPNEVKPKDAVAIYLVAILASVTGSVIAAVKAARVWPVEALRYE